MRITTDRKAALADASNRAEAMRQMLTGNPHILKGVSIEDTAQWIDDIINDWVDELRHDLGVY